MELTNTNTAKWIAVVAAVAVALAFLVAPAPTSADHNNDHTIQQLTADLSMLMNQIAALQGQTGTGVDTGIPASFQFTRDLTLGSTGTDVMYLQMFLNANGHTVASSGAGSPGNETSYYGQLTRSALASYQSAQGIAPAVGYFGPITRANVNPKLVSMPPPTGECPAGHMMNPDYTTGSVTVPMCIPDTGPDQCPEGYMMNPDYTEGSVTVPMCIEDDEEDPTTDPSEGFATVTLNSTPANNAEVKYNQTKGVLGFDIKASGSNITVNRVELKFNERMWLLVDEISLMHGSTELASTGALSSSSFDEIVAGSDYRLRFQNLNHVIPQDQTHEFTVRVTGKSLLSSANLAKTPTVSFADANAVRYTDTIGLSQTTGSTSITRTFRFSSATAGTLTVTRSPNNPDEGTLAVHDVNEVERDLLLVNLKAENNDVTVNTATVSILPGGGTSASALLSTVWLKDGSGNVLASANPSSTTTDTAETITFTEVEHTVSEGSTDTLTVSGTFKTLGASSSGTVYEPGDTITANSFTVTDAHDGEFDTVSASGTPSGEIQRVYKNFVSPSLNGSMTAENSGADDKEGSFMIPLTFTAHGSVDLYVSATNTNVAAVKTEAGVGGTLTWSTGSCTSNCGTNSWRIPAGSSRSITVSGNVPVGGSTGFTGMKINSFKWGTSVTGDDVTQNWGVSDFVTPEVNVKAS